MSDYCWGTDGYGRAHIAKKADNIIILSMLLGWGGHIGVWLLEDQDNE